MGLFQYHRALCFSLLVLEISLAGSQNVGRIYPGFVASWDQWSHNYGLFLLSNSSVYGFGFYTAPESTFLLVVIHISSAKVVWAVDKESSDARAEKFVFDKYGNAYLQKENGVAWSTNTSRQKVTCMELGDSGNLVLLGEGEVILWQSFDHPTNTLLPGQEFHEGMILTSYPKSNKIRTHLEFKSGDLELYAGFQTPQKYWSLANDSRKINHSISGRVHSASLVANAWNFYDKNKTLLWQFYFSNNTDETANWAVILDSDGAVSFFNIQRGNLATSEAFKIPQNLCGIPEPCDPYRVCTFDNLCECPTSLFSRFNCEPPIASTCNISEDSAELFYVGLNLDYFALEFVTPIPRYNLDACKEACLRNCSCSVLFFENSTQNCFLFDQIGSLQHSDPNSTGYVSYVKISRGNSHEISNGRKKTRVIVVVVVASVLVMAALLYLGIWYHRKKISMKFSEGKLEEYTFLNRISGNPVHFSYKNLRKATKNFSQKVGQGGFGSVYLGVLPDGTQLAVKKLEAIGQGKEFIAEVSTIGKVHHLHLAKLRGFCAEGSHRLLVYDYMRNGSLNKWIFKVKEESQLLSWNTRFNIALGTAKGLAYLHSECEVKIVHCDIKPENVLLDDNFNAKVSDFGMAKLMNHEESLAYTTLRGTRGYLAPEWIKNSPISEKSDVYSYGMVLFEIISGRRSYDLGNDSEIFHYPSYAFKMLEEGKLREIIDPMLGIDEIDERAVTAIKVAFWCTQEEMHLRPPMTKVVQMLEGQCAVPQPLRPSQLSSPKYSGFIIWNSEEATSSELLGEGSGGLLSDVRLSGPR